jgi:hypothetical protein
LAGIVALTMIAGLGAALAADDEEDVPLDTKLLRQFMHSMGLQRDDPGIDYQERAPLVVPPTRALPPPQSESPAARVPAWPKDPDVAARRAAKAAAAEKARIHGDNVTESMRVLRPDELGGAGVAPTPSGGPTRPSGEEAARPLPPSQLQGSKNWWDMFSSLGPQRAESAPFPGEPPRTTMTAPPTGYQTPSPNQPYGVGPPRDTTYKPSTWETRQEPAR